MNGGYVDGPDGMRLKITKQEFPYDIGIYQNAKQAMGGSCLTWLLPFASTPTIATGLNFETNGFEGSRPRCHQRMADPNRTWDPMAASRSGPGTKRSVQR